MAPKGTLKRPAAAAAEGLRKKSATADPVAADCALVAEAVQAAEELPQEVRRMLGSALLLSLAVPKPDRHPFQEDLVAMVGVALNKVKTSSEAAVATALAASEAALVEHSARLEAQVAVEGQLAAVQQSVERLQEAASVAQAAHQAAARVQKEAEVAEKRGNKELSDVAKQKEGLEKVLAESFAPLKESAVVGPEGKQRLKALAAAGKKYSLEEGLMSALPGVLAKEPGQRGEFDVKVLQQLDGEIAARIASMEGLLATGVPARDERAMAAQAARDAAGAAAAASESASNVLAAEHAVEAEARKSFAAAQTAAEGAAAEAARSKQALSDAEARLAALGEGALAAFARLRDPPPPAPEALDAPEEAVKEQEGMAVADSAPEAAAVGQSG